jgi:hypothetical protein
MRAVHIVSIALAATFVASCAGPGTVRPGHQTMPTCASLFDHNGKVMDAWAEYTRNRMIARDHSVDLSETAMHKYWLQHGVVNIQNVECSK